MNVTQVINNIICCLIYFFFLVVLFDDMTYSSNTSFKVKFLYFIGVVVFGILFLSTLSSLITIHW